MPKGVYKRKPRNVKSDLEKQVEELVSEVQLLNDWVYNQQKRLDTILTNVTKSDPTDELLESYMEKLFELKQQELPF